MKPTQDALYIISQSQTSADAIRQSIELRGIDDIITMPFEAALGQIQKKPPVLVIIDAEDNTEATAQLLTQLPTDIQRIVLTSHFEEEAFLTVYEQGVRDYLVKPVPNAYLVATIIRLLQERRQQQIIIHKDRILEEMGVLSNKTGVFTTSYFLKTLEAEFHQWHTQSNDSLCLLIVQYQGLQDALPEHIRTNATATIAQIIKDCARDSDLTGELFISKFSVILPHTAIRGARALARRLTEQLQHTYFKGPESPLDISIQTGIADADGCPHYEALLERALDDLQQQPSSVSNSIHIV